LVTWRALEQIPVAGLNPSVINQLLQTTNATNLIYAIASGMPLARFSIVAMGIGPYIDALIIVSIASICSHRLRTMRENPDGRLRLQRWTRALAVALSMGQAYGWTVLMQTPTFPPAMGPMDWFSRLAIILQLTGGTMILVLLADTLDELGLGFGNGAVLIYAVGPVAGEVHRLAYLFASTPSVEALYRPFAIWVGFSIAVVVATVAVMRAVRRVPGVEGNDERLTKRVELKLLLSGILRPPVFANAILFAPVIVANYYIVANPGVARWIYDVATPYGSNPWTDGLYVAIDACLMIGFAFFVVFGDFGLGATPKELMTHIYRLTFIGGIFLAVTVVALPVLEWNASRFAGTAIPLSGFDAVLVVAMILAIVGALERSGKRGRGVPVLTSRLP
jgi:preprotein translocase subunit SecY